MRIFLHMYGTANDPQFGNDGAMAAAKRKKQFQEEKQELKRILHEELGLFKGRSTATASTTVATDPAAPRFQVLPDETTPGPAANGPTTRVRERKGLGRLLNQENEKEEVIFEVE